MKSPLIAIEIFSTYFVNGKRVLLPKRMASCTPDTRSALFKISNDVEAAGGNLFLSDLFRSYDMQLQSHLDFVNKKKKAFSPPPGGSLHEAGRAIDLDLDGLGMSLKDFWPIATQHGFFPIISTPNSKMSEAWHFDCRGSHNVVYEYYVDGKGTNMKPYQAMAASAILAIGVQVDRFGANQNAAAIQAGLIRLGNELGNIDGSIGKKTRDALEQAGVPFGEPAATLSAVEDLLRQKFPDEYTAGTADEFSVVVPGHVIP